MRIRTGHGPSDWTPNEPASARVKQDHYALGAVTGESMVPVLRTPDPLTANRRAQVAEAHKRYREKHR